MQIQDYHKIGLIFGLWVSQSMYIEEEIPIHPSPIDQDDSFYIDVLVVEYVFSVLKEIYRPMIQNRKILNILPQPEMDIAEGKEQLLPKTSFDAEPFQQCPQMSEEVSKLLEPSVADDCVLNIIAIFYKINVSNRYF